MERLTGLDASFLYNETRSLHMHTLKYAVLDVTPLEGGFTLDRLRTELADRLHLLPQFRRRLVEVPFGLHHPVWIEDGRFRLEDHVQSVLVPAPGGRQEMDEVISRLAGSPLDRRRPLWECWVLEGLATDIDDPSEGSPDGSRVGFLVKMHHALADGVAAAALLANVMDPDPGAPVPPPARPWSPEPVPGAWELILAALRDAVADIRKLPALVRRTVANLRKVRARRKGAEVSPPRPIIDAPRTHFNGSLSPRRAFATAEMDLGTVKEVRAAFDVSVNDVVLGIVAGSLRRHLESVGGLPEKSLLASIPVAADPASSRLTGNRVSNLFTSLRTDLADPVERLHAIHEVTGASKEVQGLLGVEMMADWIEYTPPRPYAWVMRLYGRLGVAGHHAPPINLIVSNVPGPREPLHIAGARLDGIWSVGPILEGVGLNVTVWSYLDRVHVGVLGCADHWSGERGLRVITDGMADSLAELHRLASSAAAPA
jgi:WS/DGAT/MGAT family acyltransferase